MSTERLFRRVIAVVALSVVVLSVVASTNAFAHDPIILTEVQTTPDSGPLLVDGTISFALYGTLLVPGDTRGVRVQLQAGDSLDLSLLVPALDPEQSLADAAMPMLSVVRPDGSPEFLRPTERVRFDESFSGTSYVRLLEFSEPAQAGVYRLMVSGDVPARFTLAVGTNERFGTPVENVVDREGASAGIAKWYATPPSTPSSSTPSTTATTSTLPIAAAAPDSTVGAATSTSGPLVTAVPQTGQVDGAAGSAVFIGVIVIILGGVGFLIWSKRRSA